MRRQTEIGWVGEAIATMSGVSMSLNWDSTQKRWDLRTEARDRRAQRVIRVVHIDATCAITPYVLRMLETAIRDAMETVPPEEQA